MALEGSVDHKQNHSWEHQASEDLNQVARAMNQTRELKHLNSQIRKHQASQISVKQAMSQT
jgi:hypothetical protein